MVGKPNELTNEANDMGSRQEKPFSTFSQSMDTGPADQDQYYFVQTSTFSSFYLEMHKNKFKNLIRISKLKFSFQGLD